MVAVKNSDSIPPLLDTLDRFEKMSYHKMNVDKTMLLLLGDQELRYQRPHSGRGSAQG